MTLPPSTASPDSAFYEVVYDKVAVRAAPSTSSNILRALCRGQIVQGEPMQIEGELWLKLDAANRRRIFVKQDYAWMLIDGRCLGLGQLLQPYDPFANSEVMQPKRAGSVTTIAFKSAQLCDRLGRSQRVALQEASVAQYSKEDFQQELHATWSALEGDARKQIEARAALCVKIQSLVFKALFKTNRGFQRVVSSIQLLLNIFHGHACFSPEDKPSGREAELSAWLMWLLNPCAQAAHPRGLPPEVHDSTAAALADMSGMLAESRPPRNRVLARIPAAFGFCTSHFESSFRVEVLSGLTGDRLCMISARSSNTVVDLKQQIRSLADVAAAEQKLIYGTRVLRDWESLRSICATGHSMQSCGAHQQATGDKLTLVLMRVDSERASCLKNLEKGALHLWDLESHDISDPEYALTLIRHNKSMLTFLPEGLYSNLDFMTEAVRLQVEVLKYASKDLQATPEIVLIAVQRDGSALQHAATSLRNDRAIVIEAVENDGLALRFASTSLQANLEVALAAVQQSGLALQYVHPNVPCLRDVAITALQQNKQAYKFVAPALQQDLSFLASLDNLCLFDNAVLEPLLRIENNQANALLQKSAAVFIDARGTETYHMSRVHGALSLPYASKRDNISHMPAYKVIVEHPSLVVIVYSDRGEETSHCAHVARQLRRRPEIHTHRVLCLVGGLNLWKREGLDVHGDCEETATGQGTEFLTTHIQAQDGAPFSLVKGCMMSEFIIARNHLAERSYLEKSPKQQGVEVELNTWGQYQQ